MSLKTSSATLGTEVRVPGSVANLGGGFETLGVAVRLYLRATIADIRDVVAAFAESIETVAAAKKA